MQTTLKLTCPYCQNKQLTLLPVHGPEDQAIILCDPEEGGCDSYYGVFIQAHIKCQERMIEGEGQHAAS